MKIFRHIGPADYITSLNGLLGFLAVMYIIDTNYKMASILVLVIIILDGLDGWVARFLKSKHQLGKYLDSISDMVSFSFAPATFIYSMFYNLNYTSFNYWPNAAVVFVCFLVIGFGMLRLAWFVEYGQKLDHFQGLPTPAMALFIIILLQPSFQVWLDMIVTLLAILAVTIMTIADVKYPKLTTPPMALITGIVIVITIIVIGFDFSSFVRMGVLLLALTLLMVYIVLGPIYIEHNQKNIK
jgi:CDP-diacylglycerol--serine O-phosphatidyltransferase